MWMNDSIDGFIEKPKVVEHQGYTLKDQKIIRCNNCSKDLIDIIKVKDSDVEIVVQGLCTKCGEKTFKKSFKGKVYIVPCDGVEFIDTESDGDLNLVKVKIL